MVSKKHAERIYQLKITLVGSKPPIWRRMLVADNIPLRRLHWVLQVGMGWTNSHMHQFVIGDTIFGSKNENDFYDFGPKLEDENNCRLSQLLHQKGDWLRYEYDFGDGWVHRVLLEKVLPNTPRTEVPKSVTGKRACPPEDCGGIYGYEHLVEALYDESHPEHSDIVEWMGEEFDPEFFDSGAVNAQFAERFR